MAETETKIGPYFIRPELLLHPSIPRQLHQVSPRNLRTRAWWDKTRHEAYAKNNHHCWACGQHFSEDPYRQWLEGHEIYEIHFSKGWAEYINTCALCHCCHQYIHQGFMGVLLSKGKIDRDKFDFVILRGDNILSKNNLKRLPYPINIHDNWEDWYLLFEGQRYYSPYKGLDEWVAAYRPETIEVSNLTLEINDGIELDNSRRAKFFRWCKNLRIWRFWKW